eukprot:scaffold1042_cov401-Prasinococcus_capsulatus_cf.AAC.1
MYTRELDEPAAVSWAVSPTLSAPPPPTRSSATAGSISPLHRLWQRMHSTVRGIPLRRHCRIATPHRSHNNTARLFQPPSSWTLVLTAGTKRDPHLRGPPCPSPPSRAALLPLALALPVLFLGGARCRLSLRLPAALSNEAVAARGASGSVVVVHSLPVKEEELLLLALLARRDDEQSAGPRALRHARSRGTARAELAAPSGTRRPGVRRAKKQAEASSGAPSSSQRC